MIIGITGPIGHGKTSLASALETVEPSTKHFESSILIAKVADDWHGQLTDIPSPGDLPAINSWLNTLPPILEKLVHVQTDLEQIRINPGDMVEHPEMYSKLFAHLRNLEKRPELTRQHITPENKPDHRPLLQWLGGYLVAKTKPTIWYDEMARLATDAEASGVELCVIGGLRYPSDAEVIRSVGGLVINIFRPGQSAGDQSDPTERERAKIQADTTVINNGSLDELQKCSEVVLSDIRANNLQSKYEVRSE